MGDEVKITVIATGFKDQMPERRARMLSVEETPMISVPVMAPQTWLEEPAAPARFLSQDEEPQAAPVVEQSAAPARPQFVELTEESTPLPQGRSAEYGAPGVAIAEETRAPQYAPAGEEGDLDTPAFLRRLQF